MMEILKEKPKKILEVGCGEGANLVNLKTMGFEGELIGVDSSIAKIDFAKRQVLGAKFRLANAYRLPFNSQQFALVFAKNLLHHLADPKRAIREMTRVCRAGGKVMIFEGNGRNIFNFFFAHLFLAEKKGIESTPENLENLITEEKFLSIDKVFLSEPFNFFRVLFHYHFGLPGLVRCGKFWLMSDKFFSRLMPKSQYGYIIIKARRLEKPKKLESLRAHREIAHFRQLFEERKGSSWWGHKTPAGKARLARRGQMVTGFIKKGDKVLEIGSGMGEFTRYLVKTGAEITGLEITSEFVKKTRETIKAKNVVFCQGDIHGVPFKNNSFDFVVGNAILHHLDLKKALPEITRVLKNKGKIILFEPNLTNPHVFLERKISILRRLSGVSPDETAFFRWRLKKSLERAGFKNVQVRPFDFLHPLTPKALIGLVKMVEPLLEITPILKEISGSLFVYAEA